MWLKTVIIFLLLVVFFSLGRALIAMVKGGDLAEEQMIRSLTMRMALSILIFTIIIAAAVLGYIKPFSYLPKQTNINIKQEQ